METKKIIFIIISLLVSILIAYYQYFFKVKEASKVNFFLSILRTISLFLLFLLLINPNILKTEIIYQKPKLSVLIDNSSSISYLNQDTIVNSIVDDFKAHQKLSKKFDINYYSFGNQLQLTDRLTFDENQTRIEEPLKKVSEVVNQKNHAIVLISDGNQTFGNDYQYMSLKTPVYPIVIGDTTQYEDLSISQINHNQYSFLNNQFPIEFFISYAGTRDVKKRFKIENNKGEVLYSKDLNLSKDHKSISFQTKLRAKKKGLNNFKAKIENLKNEKNTTNNLKSFSIEVLNKQSKILIVSSIHHPDIGMLKKSIEGDKQRKVDHIILKNKKIKITDYQLVILYQPTNNFTSLFKELKNSQIPYFLITGPKTDWSFLNKENLGIKKNQINQIENYSASFNTNYLDFYQKDIRFQSFPPLIDLFGTIDIFIPHQILLYQNMNGFSTNEPLLVTAKENKIKKAFLFGEGLWKWRSTSFLNNKTFQTFDEFIGNLVQFLSSNNNRSRLDVDIETNYNANAIINIGAYFTDNNYQFDDRASLSCSIVNKITGKKVTMPFVLSTNSYQLELTSLEPGEYEYEVRVENQNISTKGVFTMNEFNVEEQFRVANKEKLSILAERTLGKTFFDHQYQQLLNELSQNTQFLTIQKSREIQSQLIDWKGIMTIIFCLLSIEWFTRKFYGKL